VTEQALVDAAIDEEFRILVEASLAGDEGRYWGARDPAGAGLWLGMKPLGEAWDRHRRTLFDVLSYARDVRQEFSEEKGKLVRVRFGTRDA
jgi:hypothetical protein